MEDTPKMLYKYVSPERVDILERLKIRFTEADQLNDPYECTPIFSEAFPSDELAAASLLPNEQRFIDYYPASGENPFERFTVTQRAEINDLLVMATEAVLKTSTLILSLSETCDNLLMWAHYTSNHQGLVIGFDAHHRFFQGNNWGSGALDLAAVNKVTYTSHRPQFNFVTDITKSAAFFTKSPEWQYEREWRMLRTLEEEDERIYNSNGTIFLFAVPSDAVRCVILGAASSDETQERAVAAIRGNTALSHVRVLKAELDKLSYKLLFKNLA